MSEAEGKAAVVGAGLAGCEAAWQLARAGVSVWLYEMRPGRGTGAHTGGGLAELVCSNSLKSVELHSAHGCLKAELEILGSMLLAAAKKARVPAGAALAVDRELFSAEVERAVSSQPLIRVIREEVLELPQAPALLATGPLTGPELMARLEEELGRGRLFFHDATSPVVTRESLDLAEVFPAGRGVQGADYLNVGLSAEAYEHLWRGLLTLPRAPVHGADRELVEGGFSVFEGCLPLELLAERGRDAPRFGPLRPVGLRRPGSGESFHAVLQLRAEDREKTRYSLVGCQTRLTPAAQRKLFRSLPGMERAEFVRYGRMHRNSYLDGPALLEASLEVKKLRGLFIAGQLSGAEGYVEAVATGLLAGANLARRLSGLEPVVPPPETMLGALVRTVAGKDRPDENTIPCPTGAHFGLLPPLSSRVRGKRLRREAMAHRALAAMRAFRWRCGLPQGPFY
ncbi:MAG TPA: methylenetetrahydrofolate--tRNA-(uracil(54)-C(5))-methyltransferase (FADH(2)-oxidizing) TrmFO, partial [Candidatus Coatesbacteria bacterium]|nr:methylenetetrahydrofolate--tRNA-(uracil(54)-C(5))-methyltransferase (FADH(2)-oxidizing) TrmFO [Candidatus Coatesbacteria bacterium]